MKIGTFLSDPASINLPGAPGVGGVPQTTPNDFGANVGAATQQAGQALIRTGVVLGDINRRLQADAKEERNKTIAADTASARGKWDFSGDYIAATTTAGERPENFGTTVGEMYDAKRDAYLDTIKDNDVRRETRKALDLERERWVQQANIFQNTSGANASKRDADTAIDAVVNSVRTDPSFINFQSAEQKLDDIIATRPNLTADVKATMRKNGKEMLARRRFEAMVESTALDPQALEGVQKELEDPVWRAKLSNQDYDRLRDNITTLSKAANSQEVSLARSALGTLKERNADPAAGLIPDDEMTAVHATVVKSGRHEFISAFAKIQQTQNIYKDMQGLPIEEMRAKVEKLRASGSITSLPPLVQDGITQASSLTNGKVSASFLAGLVNTEYSAADIAAGNYSKPTGLKNPDGSPSSDALGLTQFTSGTWLETVRKHADALGVDPKLGDMELLEKRKDPVMSLKVAAMHAQDNAAFLRDKLGREPTDTDLYFAHFLGAGGAARYLQGSAANPNAPALNYVDAAQVNANRPVFYDESGKPKTVTQVNTYISDKMGNGPSAIGYSGLKAAENYIAYTQKAVRDDMVTFGQSTGRYQVGDMQSPEGIAQRAVAVKAIADEFGVPPKPLTKGEVETFGAQVRDGTAEEKMAVLTKIAQLGTPSLIAAANKQIGEKDSLYGFAAGAVVARPDMKGVAMDVFRGEARLKADKDAKTFIGAADSDILSTWNNTVGKAVIGTTQASTLRQAAIAYYVEHSIAKGGVAPGTFSQDGFKEAIHAVLGGSGNPGGSPLATVNGSTMILPPKMTEGTFTTALRRMTTEDYVALSSSGTVPRYSDGKPISPEEIARSGQFESVGAGQYRIKMGDGQYAITAAYKDGSTDFYIMHGDPDRLLAAAARVPSTAPLRPVVPGVQPARPRVLGTIADPAASP